mmetsp:Transcript_21187/g.32198  ORF Transcript_21187/g.32198 Transcript_21187/m.32198 type:complete len:207 (+) Transcript_21187:426-1046(+)
MAPASESLDLRVPLKAILTIPLASSLPSKPPSKPPTYSPLMKTKGTEVRPTIFPSWARIGLPSAHGSSRRTILTSAPMVSNASTAFLQEGELSHVNITHGAETFSSLIFSTIEPSSYSPARTSAITCFVPNPFALDSCAIRMRILISSTKPSMGDPPAGSMEYSSVLIPVLAVVPVLRIGAGTNASVWLRRRKRERMALIIVVYLY